MANLYIRYNKRDRNTKTLDMSSNSKTLKSLLLTELVKDLPDYNGEPPESMHHVIFKHDDGLRLTYTGYLLMRRKFEAYSFDIPKPLVAGRLKALQQMVYPYFITEKRLVLFSEMDATVLTLAGGVSEYLENNI